MKKKKKTILGRMLSYTKGLFLSGLFTVLPLFLTVFIITFTYSFIARQLEPLNLLEPEYMQKIPGINFIIVTVCILLLGLLLRLFFILPIVHWFERLIKKIPFIRTVYSSSKILVNFFSTPDPKMKHKQVVLVEFPHKGMYNIGFLLAEATNNFQTLIPEEKQVPGKIYYKVFMPNSPNPTSGYFLILCEDDIIPTKMTFDEAIKAVVSCGLITPNSIKQKMKGNLNN